MRLSSGRRAPRLVPLNEAGACRPIFAADPTYAYFWVRAHPVFEFSRDGRPAFPSPVYRGFGVYLLRQANVWPALWRKVRPSQWRMS
jgi:hypothetical protein